MRLPRDQVYLSARDNLGSSVLLGEGIRVFAVMTDHETYANQMEYPTDARKVHNKRHIGVAQLKRLAVLAAYKSGWLFFVRPSVIQEYLSEVQNTRDASDMHGSSQNEPGVWPGPFAD